jgi:hypothetical protein
LSKNFSKKTQILEISVSENLELKSKTAMHQINKENSTSYLQQKEKFHQENKKQSENIVHLYKSQLEVKDLFIANQQKIIDIFTTL